MKLDTAPTHFQPVNINEVPKQSHINPYYTLLMDGGRTQVMNNNAGDYAESTVNPQELQTREGIGVQGFGSRVLGFGFGV